MILVLIDFLWELFSKTFNLIGIALLLSTPLLPENIRMQVLSNCWPQLCVMSNSMIPSSRPARRIGQSK